MVLGLFFSYQLLDQLVVELLNWKLLFIHGQAALGLSYQLPNQLVVDTLVGLTILEGLRARRRP